MQSDQTPSDPEERALLLLRQAEQQGSTDPAACDRAARRGLSFAARARRRDLQAECYLHMGRSALRQEQVGRAELHLRRAERLFDVTGDPRGIAQAWMGLGMAARLRGDIATALELLGNALDEFERTNDRTLQARTMIAIGSCYFVVGDMARSLELHHRASELAPVDSEAMILSLSGIGSTYSQLGDFEKALEVLQRAEEICLRTGEEAQMCRVLINRGTAITDPAGRLDIYARAMDIAERYNLVGSLRILHLNIGAALGQCGEVEKALDAMRRAEQMAEETNNLWAAIFARINRAWLTKMSGDRIGALALFRNVLDIARDSAHLVELMRAHAGLAAIYEEEGDFQNAFAHSKEESRLREELSGRERQQELRRQQLRMEIEATERERERLRGENDRLRTEMAEKTRELTSLAMQLVQKNDFLKELQDRLSDLSRPDSGADSATIDRLTREIASNRDSAQDWHVFDQQFRRIHPAFMDNLARVCPSLSQTELKVCALLKIDLSTKDVANVLGCSVRTVEDHRLSVRRKMGLQGKSSLQQMLREVSRSE